MEGGVACNLHQRERERERASGGDACDWTLGPMETPQPRQLEIANTTLMHILALCAKNEKLRGVSSNSGPFSLVSLFCARRP